MKIENTTPIGSPRRNPGRKPGRTDDAVFSVIQEDAEPSKAVAGTASIATVDSLRVLQEVDGDGRPWEPCDRANHLLDRLEALRLALLSGGIPRRNLLDLQRMVERERGAVGDKHLAALLDEIDLRVKVELAKHMR